jgi:hypothetical protein
MSAVWIAQCLCGPRRHAILAAAVVAEDRDAAEQAALEPLRTHVARMIGSGTIDPWCGLCHSPRDCWLYELGRTRFTSMEEAAPALRQSEREQAAIGRIFGER